MIDRPSPAAGTTNDIEMGDALARSGDWQNAIDHWQNAAERDPGRRGAVEHRLTWLLEQTHAAPKPLENRAVRLVVGAAVAALLGTVLVLVAPEPGSTAANVLAIGAWVLFIASATMSLIAARGRAPLTYDDLLARARRRADQLAHEQHEDATT